MAYKLYKKWLPRGLGLYLRRIIFPKASIFLDTGSHMSSVFKLLTAFLGKVMRAAFSFLYLSFL